MVKSADPKTLIQQLASLVVLPVTRDAGIQRGRLVWCADLQPTPLSRVYRVRLEYIYRGPTPRVTVLKPNLRAEGIDELPHVLSEDSLCLCYPWQWDDGKLISRTVVPWISEWLLHYELWMVDRVWHGGGHEPAVMERV